MSLRDTLARKQRRETHYDLLVDDPTSAEDQVDQARAALARASTAEQADAARASLEEARAALAACVHRVTFRNLSPSDFEALISAHPPVDKDSDDLWNAVTFAPALIAACAVDSDMSEDDWTAELGSDRWSRAETNGIFAAALNANITARSVSIPKG